MIKVMRQAIRVPNGIALPGFFRSPDILTPAENKIIINTTLKKFNNYIS